MARYNEILAGRFNRGLQKFFGIKGGPPASQLTSEISVEIPLFWGTEARYLESWALYSIAISQVAGGAGNNCGFRIRNPKGSNAIAIVTMLALGNQNALAIVYRQEQGAATTDLGTIATAVRLDNRWQSANSMMIVSESNNSALAQLGGASGSYPVPQNAIMQDYLFGEETPILPGDAWQVREFTGNQGMDLNVMWRERTLEEGELF